MVLINSLIKVLVSSYADYGMAKEMDYISLGDEIDWIYHGKRDGFLPVQFTRMG